MSTETITVQQSIVAVHPPMHLHLRMSVEQVIFTLLDLQRIDPDLALEILTYPNNESVLCYLYYNILNDDDIDLRAVVRQKIPDQYFDQYATHNKEFDLLERIKIAQEKIKQSAQAQINSSDDKYRKSMAKLKGIREKMAANDAAAQEELAEIERKKTELTAKMAALFQEKFV